ncbi:hypothetical protein METHP14_330009 [Pseudomonas sp. P14-2025]
MPPLPYSRVNPLLQGGLVWRLGRTAAPDNLRIKAEIPGPLRGPIATQGRSHRARVAF